MADLGTGRVSFVIHDLNSWGGQDRVTLEISQRISRGVPVDLYSFTYEGKAEDSAIIHHAIRPNFSRPVILKSAIFHGVTFFKLLRYKRRTPGALIHAAGACALISDVIQVHFVHRAWHAIEGRTRGRARGLRERMSRFYHWFLRRYDLLTESLTFKPNRRFIAVSEQVAAELRNHYPSLRSIEVVHPGVDPVAFCPESDPSCPERTERRVRLGIGDHEVVALFVGSYARKGLATAIAAWGSYKKQGGVVPRLVAVGEGDVAFYKELARSCGISDDVIFVSRTREIRSYYRMADFLLLPTLYEPFGMVVLEAMACGLTPVVSRRAGASELIEENVNGIVIDNPEDSDEIARIVRKVAESRKVRDEMGRKARLTAENQSWDRVAQRYMQVLWGQNEH